MFVAGGTGYIGRAVLPLLSSRGHGVRALVRPGSEGKLPAGVEPVIGDALRGETFAARIPPSETFLQLVGVAHPSPSKAALFRSVDLASAKPRRMPAYWEARVEAEDHIARLGLAASILRPWYVLGPGHLWPQLLRPGYWIAERLPGTREAARRLGLVAQMAAAIVRAVGRPASRTGIRIVEVPEIRAALPLPPPS